MFLLKNCFLNRVCSFLNKILMCLYFWSCENSWFHFPFSQYSLEIQIDCLLIQEIRTGTFVDFQQLTGLLCFLKFKNRNDLFVDVIFFQYSDNVDSDGTVALAFYPPNTFYWADTNACLRTLCSNNRYAGIFMNCP